MPDYDHDIPKSGIIIYNDYNPRVITRVLVKSLDQILVVTFDFVRRAARKWKVVTRDFSRHIVGEQSVSQQS